MRTCKYVYDMWEKFCRYQLNELSNNKDGLQLHIHYTHTYSFTVYALHKYYNMCATQQSVAAYNLWGV